MTREQLLSSPEYWIVDIQTKLYEALENYRQKKGFNRTQLAADLGYSKGYISQILNGDFDHRISKLVELSLKIDSIPQIQFKPLAEAMPATTSIQAGSYLELNVSDVGNLVNINSISSRKDNLTKKVAYPYTGFTAYCF